MMNRQGEVFERNYLHAAMDMDPLYSGSMIVGSAWGGGGQGDGDGKGGHGQPGSDEKGVLGGDDPLDKEWAVLLDGGVWREIVWMKMRVCESEDGVVDVFAGGKLERVNPLKYTGTWEGGFKLDIIDETDKLLIMFPTLISKETIKVNLDMLLPHDQRCLASCYTISSLKMILEGCVFPTKVYDDELPVDRIKMVPINIPATAGQKMLNYQLMFRYQAV